jgi:hypothetical protein
MTLANGRIAWNDVIKSWVRHNAVVTGGVALNDPYIFKGSRRFLASEVVAGVQEIIGALTIPPSDAVAGAIYTLSGHYSLICSGVRPVNMYLGLSTDTSEASFGYLIGANLSGNTNTMFQSDFHMQVTLQDNSPYFLMNLDTFKASEIRITSGSLAGVVRNTADSWNLNAVEGPLNETNGFLITLHASPQAGAGEMTLVWDLRLVKQGA